jgi:hypothetical protein
LLVAQLVGLEDEVRQYQEAARGLLNSAATAANADDSCSLHAAALLSKKVVGAICDLVRTKLQLVVRTSPSAAADTTEAIVIVANLLKGCFSATPSARPTAKACEELLQQAYLRIGDISYLDLEGLKQKVSDDSSPFKNYHRSFQLPRVREARFHRFVSKKHRKAASLLRQQLDEEIVEAATKSLNTAGPKLVGPELTHHALMDGTLRLSDLTHVWDEDDFRYSHLLPVVMDLIEICLEDNSTTTSSSCSSSSSSH